MTPQEYIKVCRLIGHANEMGREAVMACVSDLEKGEAFSNQDPDGTMHDLPLVAMDLVDPILISRSEELPESEPKVTMDVGDAETEDLTELWDMAKIIADFDASIKHEVYQGSWVASMFPDDDEEDDGEGENPFDGLTPTWEPHPNA